MNILQNLERLFLSLAEDLNYSITQDEIIFLIGELAPQGLIKVKEACLAFMNEPRPSGTFPCVVEFERKISELNFTKQKRA